MSEIILDIGSGSNLPDAETAKRFIDAIAEIDSQQHMIRFKTQLFTDIPPNKPLDHGVFEEAYWYASDKGYDLTSSVFDIESLEFLLGYDVPFIKIACRPGIYWMIDEVPGGTETYVSVDGPDQAQWADVKLLCVPEYPATMDAYLTPLMHGHYDGISDHTVGLDLYQKTRPNIWEHHIKLPDTEGPDAGEHALLVDELRTIL